MSIYKYVSTTNLIHILNSNIRFTQASAFNDPFELVPQFLTPESLTGRDVNFSFNLTAKRGEKNIGRLADDFDSETCNDFAARDMVKSLNSTVGILCLTRNPESLPMWAHYADNYAGAVIEFDEKHEFFEGLIEVEYTQSRPKIDLTAYIEAKEPIPIAELCFKSIQWSDEKEVRIARSFSDCKKLGNDPRGFPIYVRTIPRECILNVSMGERMSVETQREIWNLVKDTKISLDLAAVANREYAFRYEQIKFNNPLAEMSPMISPRTAHIFTDLNNDLGEVARAHLKHSKYSDIANKTL